MSNWLVIASIAQFIFGTSALADKFLLREPSLNPVRYTFWIGVLGLAALLLIPFGLIPSSLTTLLLALAAGAVFIFQMYFYFLALSKGEASTILLFIGALSPIATLVFSALLIDSTLRPYQFIAFLLLIAGGWVLFLVGRSPIRKAVFLPAVASAILFGLSTTLTKAVFLETNFVTGFMAIKLGAALMVFLALLSPALRRDIAVSESGVTPKNRLYYLGNRAYAGGGSILINYAILLGAPALVDATYSLQFIVLFLGGWLLLKERFRGLVLLGKITAVVIVGLGILWLTVGDYLSATAPNPSRPVTWGITFSQKFSSDFGMDWKRNYDAILDDLKPSRLRLVAYWDIIEPSREQFNFADLDYQMEKAQSRNVGVILAAGQKTPRWPECHGPDWTMQLEPAKRQEAFETFLKRVVERYRTNTSLIYWQVENEPFLPFGECPTISAEMLEREIALVRSLDSAHPIIVTDSGELSLWYRAAKRGDLFGTTMYRRTHSNTFGQLDYHLPPEFFRIKEKTVRMLLGNTDKRFIVIELAAEPWLKKQLYETTPEEQLKVFDLPFFQDTVSYAKATGFDEYYFWGAEWWYWMKETQHHPEFWEYAKTLF